MTPAKFSIGDAVQVVSTRDKVLVNRSKVIGRIKSDICADVKTGEVKRGDMWGYRLSEMPDMPQQYISEANLRPIPEAGDDWITLVAQLNDPANIEWMEIS